MTCAILACRGVLVLGSGAGGIVGFNHVSVRQGGRFVSLHYNIRVNKDHKLVKATWDVSVDMSDTELISSFVLTVEGKALNTQCNNPTGGGNKACKGADFVMLSNPNQDSVVTFVITTNKPDEQDGQDVLRGDKTYDDVDFSG